MALLALAALLTLRHALHAQGVKVVDLMIVRGIAIMMVMIMMMMRVIMMKVLMVSQADLNLMMVTVRMLVRPRVRLMIRTSQDDRYQEDYHVMLIARDVKKLKRF